MAISAALLSHLQGLGLTQQQIDLLLASATADGPLDDSAIAAAAARYASALASGALTPPPAAPTPAPAPPSAVAPSLVEGGATPAMPPTGNAPVMFPGSPGAQQVQNDWNAKNAGYLANPGLPPTPNRWDPNTMSGPEATLPGMAYAGTVGASALSPEQAGQVRYNTPEYQSFIGSQLAPPVGPGGQPLVGMGHPGRDQTYDTVNNLTNAYRSGGYAGTPADLNSAIAWTVDQQYLEWIGNFGLNPATAAQQGLTKQAFVQQMGAFSQPGGPQVQLNGVTTSGQQQQAMGGFPASPPSAPMYGAPANVPMAPQGNVAPVSVGGVPVGNVAPVGQAAPAAFVPPPPPPGFVATNQKYVANISAVPEAQRTAEQKTSLAAAQAKLKPYGY